jgi:hypothetical protein
MPFLILVNLQHDEEVGGRLPEQWREILHGFDRTIAMPCAQTQFPRATRIASISPRLERCAYDWTPRVARATDPPIQPCNSTTNISWKSVSTGLVEGPPIQEGYALAQFRSGDEIRYDDLAAIPTPGLSAWTSRVSYQCHMNCDEWRQMTTKAEKRR